MAFLKAKLVLIVILVVCLASVGGAVLAVLQGAETEQQMKEVSALLGKVQRLQGEAVNDQVIKAKQQEREERKKDFELTMSAALAVQKNNVFYEQVEKNGTVVPSPRKLLIDGILPEATAGTQIQFRDAYRAEHTRLSERLRGRPGPTAEEIEKQRERIRRGETSDQTRHHPWMPPPAPDENPQKPSGEKRSLADLLRAWPQALAASEVAHKVWMYVDKDAFGTHLLAKKTDTPTPVEIWQAQMSLWIQQDMATALARCNEERAEALRKQGVAEPYWVAQMPVKRLKALVIEGVLGKGGGMGRPEDGFAPSFTEERNNDNMFVVRMQLQLVIEEAALMDVFQKLCSVGFYTPLRANLASVEVETTFRNSSNLYVYGDAPVIGVNIDLEGYYFHQVFEEWVPKELKRILRTPGAKEDRDDRG